MKSILLCEGKTDAILVSYYLNKVKGWNFYGRKDRRKNDIPIKNRENEEANWYTLNEDLLAIWGIGGKDNFKYAIEKVLEINRLAKEEQGFNKIIILMDRDNHESDGELFDKIGSYLGDIELINNIWMEKEFMNSFENVIKVKILPIMIPFDKKGALETFILDAICEIGEEERYIVNKSKEYIAGFDLEKYLNTERLKVKGELAVTLGTLFPQKTFTHIDSMLRNINWEEYKTIQEGFRRLEEI